MKLKRQKHQPHSLESWLPFLLFICYFGNLRCSLKTWVIFNCHVSCPMKSANYYSDIMPQNLINLPQRHGHPNVVGELDIANMHQFQFTANRNCFKFIISIGRYLDSSDFFHIGSTWNTRDEAAHFWCAQIHHCKINQDLYHKSHLHQSASLYLRCMSLTWHFHMFIDVDSGSQGTCPQWIEMDCTYTATSIEWMTKPPNIFGKFVNSSCSHLSEHNFSPILLHLNSEQKTDIYYTWYLVANCFTYSHI